MDGERVVVESYSADERGEIFGQQVGRGAEGAARATSFKTSENLKSQVLNAYVHRSRRNEPAKAKPIEGRPYPACVPFAPRRQSEDSR